MKKKIITGLKFLILATLLTGIIYPLMVTLLVNLFFREKATGSLIKANEVTIGSKLIGQNFDSLKYFWPRPSAIKYNPMPSGGSNLGPLNPRLIEEINQRRESFILKNTIKPEVNLPSEMIFASASGLDPHISQEAALLQVKRVVRARGFDEAMQNKIIELIEKMTENRQFFLLGEPRINVFLLNLKTDSLK